jgi:hypothetical protein
MSVADKLANEDEMDKDVLTTLMLCFQRPPYLNRKEIESLIASIQ